jgi:hypothetical protein
LYYTGWTDSESITLALPDQVRDMREKGLIEKDAKLIHIIEVATAEEASAIYNLRMGYDPYRPMGSPALCPKGCGSYYYPEGSGQCPYCGNLG